MGAEWPRAQLGAVVDYITVGHVGPMAHEYVDAGIPFLRSQNVTPGGIDRADIRFISPGFHKRLAKSALRAGDVVVVRTGRPGTAAVIGPEFDGANCADLVIIRPGELVNPRFLAGFINSGARGYVAAHLVGAVQQHFNVSSARTIELGLPSAEEQRAIADVLGALDDKIESNGRVTDLLGRGIRVAHGRAVAAAVTWEPLAALGSVSGGGTPSSKVPEYWDPAEVPWITPRDMTALSGSPMVWAGERSISSAGLAASSARLLETGTVLYTSRATLGLVAIAQQPLATNQGFISITPAAPFSSAFVYATLRARTEDINAKANGSTFQEVNKTNFKSVLFACPSANALRDFDAIATLALEQIAGLVRETSALQAIRDGLLPKLVSGQIRVPLSDDVAEQIGAATDALA